MIHGTVHVSGDTLYIYANTHRVDTGAGTDADSVPTYRIYRQEDGTAVATGSTAKLDDANTVGFYSEAVSLATYDPGEYVVYLSATINSIVVTDNRTFTVGVGSGPVLVRTTIATLASQTSFTLTGGPADNNALIGCAAIIRKSTSVDQFAIGSISAYTGASKTVTLAVDPAIYTMAAGDFVEVLAPVDVAKVRGTAQTAGDIIPRLLTVASAAKAETMLDGTGGNKLTLEQLRINSTSVGGAVDIDNSVGFGIKVDVAGSGASAVALTGDGASQGIEIFGGSTGGDGVAIVAGGGNARGVAVAGAGTGAGLWAVGGSSDGPGALFEGDGNGDGATFTKAGTGVDIRGNLTGNVTGNLSGSVGSVTADVGITQTGADKVWASAARTLTSFGTLVVDVATAVWAAAVRTLTSFGTLATDVTAIKAATDNLPSAVKKNTARRLQFYMISSADFISGVNGVVVTAKRALDAGALAAAAGAITDTGTDGLWYIDAAAADLNGDTVAWLMEAAGCVPTRMTILTEP